MSFFRRFPLQGLPLSTVRSTPRRYGASGIQEVDSDDDDGTAAAGGEGAGDKNKAFAQVRQACMQGLMALGNLGLGNCKSQENVLNI